MGDRGSDLIERVVHPEGDEHDAIAHRPSCVAERAEDEENLERMTRPKASIELRGAPGEPVHVGSRDTIRVCIGQADGGDAPVPVSLDSRE